MLHTVADIFVSEDAQSLLKHKFVIFIGDSVIRGMYKDLVKLLQTNELLADQQLKTKGEFYFENDQLLDGGQKGIMSNETSYTEIRQYKTATHWIKFYFITRCYSDMIKSIAKEIEDSYSKPDVMLMNSGVWDLTRYGPNSIPDYKINLRSGLKTFAKVLPCKSLFIWVTTLPLSKDIKGGFVIPEIEVGKSKLREDVLEANVYACQVVKELQLDLIDLHYYFTQQIQRRVKDGIHWDPTAHRRITNLILHHIADGWDFEHTNRIINDKNARRNGDNSLPNVLKSQLNNLNMNNHLNFPK